MAYRDYEFDRDYGNRGSWRGRAEPWYGTGYGYQGPERGYGGQNLDRGYGFGGYDRGGYPGYGGYGYGGYTGYGYGGGYGGDMGEWRSGSTMGYETGTSRYQGRQNQGNWGQQNYSGRGPRNYRRADDRIEEDVNEALTRHPGLDATEIEVQVLNGEVTLTGTVDSRQDKRMAEDATESCPGVRDVHNQLRVSSSGSRSSEREVTRPPAQEGRGSTGGESRSGSRQSASSRSSR